MFIRHLILKIPFLLTGIANCCGHLSVVLSLRDRSTDRKSRWQRRIALSTWRQHRVPTSDRCSRPRAACWSLAAGHTIMSTVDVQLANVWFTAHCDVKQIRRLDQLKKTRWACCFGSFWCFFYMLHVKALSHSNFNDAWRHSHCIISLWRQLPTCAHTNLLDPFIVKSDMPVKTGHVG